MKHIFSIVLLLCFTTSMAQLKTFTLEDLIPGGKNFQAIQPKKLPATTWMNNKLVVTESDSTVVTYSTKGAKAKTPIITRLQINKALKAAQLDEIQKIPTLFFDKDNANQARFLVKDHWVWYDLKDKTITHSLPFNEGDTHFDFNPDHTTLALTNGNDLFIIQEDGSRIDLTTDDMPAITWGQSVHRNEFGIHKGTFWSPDGKKLAFYRMDESMVSPYPLVDVNSRVAQTKEVRYPMAGMNSHVVTVGIYDTQSKQTLYLQTGQPLDRYYTNICWTPDSKSLLIAEVNRAQNEMNLVRYNSLTGAQDAILFTESHPKYVEPEHPAFFLPGQQGQFLWLSQKDGYKHIYLHDRDGKELKQLTKGKWLVKDILGVDPSNRYVFFTANEQSPLETHLHRLDLKTGKQIALTNQKPGVHNIRLNPSKTHFLDTYSSSEIPAIACIASTKNGADVTLMDAANPLALYDMPEISVGTIKAADGETDLYYRLIKPTNFDPNKKYPAIIYLYNGPHVQLITNNWLSDARGWDIYMAQKGYVMLTVDGRGSSNRGRDFEQATHWKLGQEEGKDQMEGIKLLESLGFVDTSRIGIHGWSFGGFMTTHMMLTYPETFKVGVAGGPVIDWKYYEIMYGERYMGHPDKNAEGYASTSLLPKVGNLYGRLLMIHGDIDPVVVMQHSLQFMKHCVDARVYPDYFIYPGHEHNVIGKDRVHLHEKITRYFEDYL